MKNPAAFACTHGCALILALGLAVSANAAAPPARWVSSWFASPQPLWDTDFILPTGLPPSLHGHTVRETVRLSSGGRRIRLVFSNRYGTAPLVLGEVRVAPVGPDGQALLTAGHAVRFGGERRASVPPGAPLVSDPIELAPAAFARLAVSVFVPEPTPLRTFHWGAQQEALVGKGNLTGATAMASAQRVPGRLFLSAVLAEAPPATRTVVAFGDSITDGNGSTPGADRRWPDFLAQRFTGVAVANAGISGARLLGDRMGVNALARFEQDVLSQPGVAAVVVLIGINDIGWPGSPFAPSERPTTAARLIAGYRQLIAAAHARNVRVVGATLPPFEGALRGTPFEGHYSPAKERLRQEVNAWIRGAGAFDAVADFDLLLRDPARPSRMLPAYDSGDHLHPGDAGYRAMAGSMSLEMLFGDAGASP
ncbi:SGNH/GDSL hydrolase family protein [Massilia niabensis]|uniref:SGNH/GDSL hydrolase family protein n=1 Tax=Massilia niabensis TaxID=544910 RepID=A0ABW0L3V5_9BURK